MVAQGGTTVKKVRKVLDVNNDLLAEANNRILAMASAAKALLDELGYCTDSGPAQRKAASLLNQMHAAVDFLRDYRINRARTAPKEAT